MTQVEIPGTRLKISRRRPDPIAFRGAKHTWLLTCPRCSRQIDRSKQLTLCAGFDLFEDKPALRSLISWHFERGLISLTTCQALMRWT